MLMLWIELWETLCTVEETLIGQNSMTSIFIGAHVSLITKFKSSKNMSVRSFNKIVDTTIGKDNQISYHFTEFLAAPPAKRVPFLSPILISSKQKKQLSTIFIGRMVLINVFFWMTVLSLKKKKYLLWTVWTFKLYLSKPNQS
jgi:hypothetical protein